MNTTWSTRRVGDIVREDFRAAAVFEARGIDFCCGGAKMLGDACASAGVSTESIEADLELALHEGAADEHAQFGDMTATELITYITRTHHGYLRRVMPSLIAWSTKVANAHGERHPETLELADVVHALCRELEQHMFKEERILFPAIMTQDAMESGAERFAFGSIGNPIAMMEHEHREAGAGLEAIRRLSEGFTLPDDACATFTALYRELEAFERDLHVHIHLENNILHPKAMERERRSQAA